MKQIITVLAILISGIASAQLSGEGNIIATPPETLWTASSCGRENAKFLHVNGEDYTVLEDLQPALNLGDGLLCLERDNSIENNWMSYFVNYHGATIRDHTNFNYWRISLPNGVEIQKRVRNYPLYDVTIRRSGAHGAWRYERNNNAARRALEFANN